jgi:hypothetical protein
MAEKRAADPHLGEAVDPEATVISFDDGSSYECVDGVIVRQLLPPD